MNVELPDGTVLTDIPEGTTQAQLRAKLKANGYDVSKLGSEEAAPARVATAARLPGSNVTPEEAGIVERHPLTRSLRAYGKLAGDTLVGLGKGTQDLVNASGLNKPLAPEGSPLAAAPTDNPAERTASLNQMYKEAGPMAGVGQAAAELAITGAPAGKATTAAAGLINGSGGLAKTLQALTGGTVGGGVSGALVAPQEGESRLENAVQGAKFGAAVAPIAPVVGAAGKGLVRTLAGGKIAPEVKALANRAEQLGIDIPADRLADSKPLNALAASLEYLPFSGRTGTMNKMEDQLNTALSKTVGENSSNVTQALRRAQANLGGKFDTVLQNNSVRMDKQFLNDLADAGNMASRELGSDGERVIANQISEIMTKAGSGSIDGQAAYNIKKTLDRIGNRNSPEAFYARDLKKKLMDALDRSLGTQQAADFAQVRKQYGNMLALENIAQNGAEGGISIARLANMKNINNPELQELADISAQFLKRREGAHGAAQRAVLGTGALLTGGATGTLPAVGAAMATGRGANALLNSQGVKNVILENPPTNRAEMIARILRQSGAAAGTAANDF